MGRVLVTGASGFLGAHVVAHLTQSGEDVTCLVRASSSLDRLTARQVRFVYGDMNDESSLRAAVDQIDVVYHLAGLTKAFRASDLFRINSQGTATLARACAAQSTPPKLVVVSSLAAAGPALTGRLRREEDPVAPVSRYGASKRRAELEAARFAELIPISIVRPPIVFGPYDTEFLEMVKPISQFGVHLAPLSHSQPISLIAAEDVAVALKLVAEQGQTLRREFSSGADSRGVYFVAAEQTPSFAELGNMLAKALEKRSVRTVEAPGWLINTTASVNEAWGRIRRRPHIFNWDKAREAQNGPWACSSQRIRSEVGFSCVKRLQLRLNELVAWYRHTGALPK